jgi:hypothetical protein
MMMYVFSGPTISVRDAQETLDARYLPPAAQGDLHRIALQRPYAIGLIDGYFQRVPSVWHKEILWAMAQGIRVYGSASMGALRAAELAQFGMVGVGWVYEAFSSGVLEDDDEVAIAHATHEHAYRASSEAMVNIRCTLHRAINDAGVSEHSAERLIGLAKALHYPDRSYARLLAEGALADVDAVDLQRLRAWLPTGVVNQKRDDAIAMLRLMKADAEERRPPLEVRYSFEHTAPWEAARSAALHSSPSDPSQRSPSALEGRAVHEGLVLEELKLSGRYAAAREAATARALALEVARHVDRTMEGPALYEAISEFRRERALERDEDFEAWLEAQEISDLEFFKEEGLVRLVSRLYDQQALRLLPDLLRSTGDYARLRDRAYTKECQLAAEPRLSAAQAVSHAELIAWYFEQRLRRAVPEDLTSYLRGAGIASIAEFIHALTREYLFAQALAGPSAQHQQRN